MLASLALITVYLRESPDGGLHEAQQLGLSVLRPFEVAGERVSRPFRDAYGYVSDVFDAKAENARLKRRIEELARQAVQNETAVQENEELRKLLDYKESGRFPRDYDGITARIIGVPGSPFRQEVVVAAGTRDRVSEDAPVVVDDALVGLVTLAGRRESQVTLLSDQRIGVAALVLGSRGEPSPGVNAAVRGIVRSGPTGSSVLALDRVEKDEVVEPGDLVVTAGWRSGDLSSLYPYGIPIGVVTSVGQQDIDPYKQIQVTPFVDFDSLSQVIILVRKRR